MGFTIDSANYETKNIDDVSQVIDAWSDNLVPSISCIRIDSKTLIINVMGTDQTNQESSIVAIKDIYAKHNYQMASKQYDLIVRGKDKEDRGFEISAHWTKGSGEKAKPCISLSLHFLAKS